MNFKPQSEQEISDLKLLRAGTYEFEVLDAEDKTSKSSGKPMIELKLSVTGPGGSLHFVPDYLLAATPLKLRHAAEACGQLDKYHTGSLCAVDFLGRKGRLKLRIEKDRDRKYPDKNVVADYIPSGAHRFLLLG
jgi:hypothetical protein